MARSDLPKPKSQYDFDDIVAAVYVRLWNDPHMRRCHSNGAPLSVSSCEELGLIQ
jgi:hypothetical protein